MSDATAYVKFLDSQAMVHKKAKMGVFGYCMGGPMTMQAAAANPARIGAGASFHGGGLVTDKPESPHLKVPQMKAQFYFAIAMNDDQRQPDAKTKLAEAFKAANLPQKQRSLRWLHARLVREGHADGPGWQAALQRGRG